jgi:SAM-dependent methyltransferase
MKEFNRKPDKTINTNFHDIHVFNIDETDENIDQSVVDGFGEEWSKFDSFTVSEIEAFARSYFDILDDNIINESSYIVDFGAGSGRFSKYLSDKVRFIEILDPSNAVYVANNLLRDKKNVRIAKCSIGSSPYEDNTFDFGMSIGVLHHMPDTHEGMKYCVSKIKPGGWFYVYLYYNLDNRGRMFKILFDATNMMRLGISKLPFKLKNIACDIISVTVYVPLIALGRGMKAIGMKKLARKMPLHYYQDKTFHIIRNDALDRFGTQIEKRFSKEQIVEMMTRCGLSNIRISPQEPYWHAVGQKISG